MKKITIILLVVLTVISTVPIMAYTKEDYNSKSYEVYNGDGELIGTTATLDEAEQLIFGSNVTRDVGSFLKLCKFSAKIVSGISTVLTVIDVVYTTVQYASGKAGLLDVIDTIVPISVLKKIASNGGNGYLYGQNSFNPYPPHSYQGAMWIKSQTYYVVES